MIPSDRRERDRFLKHLRQRPTPERPPDYGRQAPRILSEIVAGMTGDYDAGTDERRRQTAGLWAATPNERKPK